MSYGFNLLNWLNLPKIDPNSVNYTMIDYFLLQKSVLRIR